MVYHHRQTILSVCLVLFFSNELFGQTKAFQSQRDKSLNYAIRVVEAEPYWQPAEKWALDSLVTTLGAFKVDYRELGTLPAERARLPVPGSTRKLTGRVGQTDDGTIYASFGIYLYWSKDEGRTWQGKALTDLPGNDGKRTGAMAFGVDGDFLYLAHFRRDLPALGESNYPVVISRSKDGGRTWQSSRPLDHSPLKYLGGDGNHIIGLGDGMLLAALDGYGGPRNPKSSAKNGLMIFRSTDLGKTWERESHLPGVAETGFVCLGGQSVLAAFRVTGEGVDTKTVRLANSKDGGRTWTNPRSLTRIYGQAHGDVASIPGGGVVAVYENRYPYAEGSAIYARVSWDGGNTWEPEMYMLIKGHGYPGSVVMKDGTIVTLAGDGQLGRIGRPTGRGYTLQAVRWKPIPRPAGD